MRFPLLIAAAALLVGPAAQAQTADSASASEHGAAGSYTEDQASRGKLVYESYCAPCHTTAFHTDEQFRFNWFGRTVFDLFKTLRTTMPDDNPGSLSDDDYTRVIAYILKLNGFAAGSDSLASDSTRMRSIRIRAAAPADSSHPPR